MNICLVHGYLLTGTGSNIYVKNLAGKLCSMGHNIFIMCQEPHAERINFVNEVYVFSKTNKNYKRKFNRKTSFPGMCRVFKPDLDGKLLVYVKDRYEEFNIVETFQESSLDKVENFILKNVTALGTIIKNYHIDFIQTNHCIMQPYIAYLAAIKKNIPYIVSLHGSALNFSVKESKILFEYAKIGLNNAKKIVAVSEYNAEELYEYFKSKKVVLKPEIKVIPAGVDLNLFLISSNNRDGLISSLKNIMGEKIKALNQGESVLQKQKFIEKIKYLSPDLQIRQIFYAASGKYNYLHPDSDVLDTLNSINCKKDKIILFVGKYLWTKGIQAIIAAIPMILKKVPEARFIFTGFGKSKEILQALIFSLSTGSSELFEYMIVNHLKLDAGSEVKTPVVCSMFLESLKKKGKYDLYFRDAKELPIMERIHFTGIMSHEELRYLLPAADVFTSPSIFTEAFGVVAIEALSSGIFPVITYNAGFRELYDSMINFFNEDLLKNMPKLYINNKLVENLAASIITILNFKKRKSIEFKKKCRQFIEEKYSWEIVAEEYIEEFTK